MRGYSKGERYESQEQRLQRGRLVIIDKYSIIFQLELELHHRF
jgi:hypothetical protein